MNQDKNFLLKIISVKYLVIATIKATDVLPNEFRKWVWIPQYITVWWFE